MGHKGCVGLSTYGGNAEDVIWVIDLVVGFGVAHSVGQEGNGRPAEDEEHRPRNR